MLSCIILNCTNLLYLVMLCNMYGDFMFCRKKSNILATFLTDKMLDYIIKKKLASVLVELLDTLSPGLFV